jgi:hypothetical protein
MQLRSINLKNSAKNKKPSRLHITDFNVDMKEINQYNYISYVDDGSLVFVLKERGCIKPKKYKQCVRRKLKF